MGCWHVFLNFLGIISYRLFLDLNYKNIISPLFEYDGYINVSTLSSYFYSWVILLVFIPFIIRLYQFQDAFFLMLLYYYF